MRSSFLVAKTGDSKSAEEKKGGMKILQFYAKAIYAGLSSSNTNTANLVP